MATPVTTAAPRAGEIAEWEGNVGSVRQLVGQLMRLRDPGATGTPTAVASVLNLVAVVDHAEAEMTEALIEGMADHQPSRTIIVARATGGEGIDAHLETRFQPIAGARGVLVEKVRLTLRGSVAEHGVASAVEPLLRRDLPMFLWWPTAPGGDEALKDLADGAHRLITEAGRIGDTRRAVECLARWAGTGGPCLTDLSWAALTPWRQLIAQLADADEFARLRRGSVAVIGHTGNAVTVEALLIAGWLRDALGDGLMVELHARPDVTEGGLASVELESSTGRRLGVELIPNRRAAVVTAAIFGAAPTRRVMPLPVSDRATLLAGELELSRCDLPFENALPHALEIATR